MRGNSASHNTERRQGDTLTLERGQQVVIMDDAQAAADRVGFIVRHLKHAHIAEPVTTRPGGALRT